jgi:hypothetical protein
MLIQASDIAYVTPLPTREELEPDAAPVRTRRFARLYDLEVERCRRTPPAEALEAVAEAARVHAELEAAGLQVRFDMRGGLSAELRDRRGALVRPLTLREIVDPTSLLPPDDAA